MNAPIQPPPTFGARLRERRLGMGILQTECAAILGVPHRTFCDWERDKTTPYDITQEGAFARLKAWTKQNKVPKRETPTSPAPTLAH